MLCIYVSSNTKYTLVKLENNSSREHNDFAKEIQRDIDKVKADCLTNHCIVFRVNPLLYEVNAEAYKPKFVIIGPLLYYKTIYEHFEMQKWMYSDSFLRRAETKDHLNDFCQLIKKCALGSYYEVTYFRTWDWPHKIQQSKRPNDGSSDVFIKMVLVDASFIIELFLRAYHDKKKGRHESDSFRRDLFLAQNQLPFFILKDLYELAFGGNSDPSFLDLTCHFFSPYYNQNKSIEDLMKPNHSTDEYRAKLEGAKHFTDLLRTLQFSDSFQKDSSIENQEADEEQGEYLYSAVLLHEAGVKFKKSTSRCLLDIEFDQRNGEFRIPSLRVDESTEPFFRNLIAWEQRYYSSDSYISDYIFLMEYLIKSTKDVDLLVRKKILINQLGSNTAVATLFNNFCKNVPKVEKNRYSDIFRKLNAYNAVRHHSWIAILRLQYFSTLWSGVATIAAVILLVLTLIQTICAVISL